MAFIKKYFWWITFLVGVLWAGYYFMTPVDESKIILSSKVYENEHTKGSLEADVLLVEYSDFQCPACKGYAPLLSQLSEDFPEKVLIVYRHFPLRQIHRYAQFSAQASVAAANQGKFFEMHDLLFLNQEEWSKSSKPKDLFISYAEEIGLNIEQYKKDLGSKPTKDKVNSDYDSGVMNKVNSTPSLFLQGKLIVNPRSYEDLKKLVEAEIEKL